MKGFPRLSGRGNEPSPVDLPINQMWGHIGINQSDLMRLPLRNTRKVIIQQENMFNYRKDKAGFFSAIVLACLVAAMVIASLILLFMGAARGQWDYYSLPIRLVIGIGWVLLVATVLTRVGIFRVQMLRKRRLQGERDPHGTEGHQAAETEAGH